MQGSVTDWQVTGHSGICTSTMSKGLVTGRQLTGYSGICRVTTSKGVVTATHRVLGHLQVDDEEGRQPLLPRQVRLAGHARRRRQLHVARDVRQPEVEAVHVHVQQPGMKCNT